MMWPFKPNAVKRRVHSEHFWRGQSPLVVRMKVTLSWQCQNVRAIWSDAQSVHKWQRQTKPHPIWNVQDWVSVGGIEGGWERGHYGPQHSSLSTSIPRSYIHTLGRREERRRRGRRREEEEEAYVLQLATIKFCKFAVIRENLSIFTVIKKNVAAITSLGDFDMRPI